MKQFVITACITLTACGGGVASGPSSIPQAHVGSHKVAYPFVTPTPITVNVPTTCDANGCTAVIE